MLKRKRRRYHRCRRSDIADEAENLVAFVKLLNGFGSAGRFIGIVRRNEAQAAPIHPAVVILRLERCLDADAHLQPELPRWPRKRPR
jgi:hypothetical protein